MKINVRLNAAATQFINAFNGHIHTLINYALNGNIYIHTHIREIASLTHNTSVNMNATDLLDGC